jgi:hypothetical protein
MGLAHKAEDAVDLETGAIIAAEVPADAADTATIIETAEALRFEHGSSSESHRASRPPVAAHPANSSRLIRLDAPRLGRPPARPRAAAR